MDLRGIGGGRNIGHQGGASDDFLLARFADPAGGGLEVQIGAEPAPDQAVQLAVMEDPPPARQVRLAGIGTLSGPLSPAKEAGVAMSG